MNGAPITIYQDHTVEWNFKVDGARAHRLYERQHLQVHYANPRTSSAPGHHSGSYKTGAILYIGAGGGKVRDALNRHKPDSALLIQLEPSEAYRDWRSYFSFGGLIAITDAAALKLDSHQRAALRQIVSLGGGQLLLIGKNPDASAKLIGYKTLAPTHPIGGVNAVSYSHAGLGQLLFTTVKQAENLNAVELTKTLLNQSRAMPTFAPFHIEGKNALTPSGLLADLQTQPRLLYTLLAIVLTFLIGPGAYIYLRRRRQIFFFFLLTPLVSIGGALIIVSATLINEGAGIKYQGSMILYEDFDSGLGAALEARSYYAAFAQNQLTFPAEAAVASFNPPGSYDLLLAYSGNQQTLSGGWIRAREPSGIFSLTPVKPRLRLHFEKRADGLYLVNALLGEAINILVKAGGEYHVIDALAPGAAVKLNKENQREYFANNLAWSKVLRAIAAGQSPRHDKHLKRAPAQIDQAAKSLRLSLDNLYGKKSRFIFAQINGEMPYQNDAGLPHAKRQGPAYNYFLATGFVKDKPPTGEK